MKGAAQDVAEDVTQDMAEDVLGAAEGGSSSVSGGNITTTAVACPKLPPSPRPQGFCSLNVRIPCWCGRPSGSGGRHVKGEHVKDAANADFQEAEKNRSAAARGDPDVSPPTHTRLPLDDT